MFDIKKIRDEFPMFKNNPTMQGSPLVYFDNAATTFKPQCVIDKENEYYSNYSANTHRGDYDIAVKSDSEYEKARDIVAKFINADRDEVCFTSGASMALNQVAFGLKKKLRKFFLLSILFQIQVHILLLCCLVFLKIWVL